MAAPSSTSPGSRRQYRFRLRTLMLLVALGAICLPPAMKWQTHVEACNLRARNARDLRAESWNDASREIWSAVKSEWYAIRDVFETEPPDYLPPMFCGTGSTLRGPVLSAAELAERQREDWNRQRPELVQRRRHDRDYHLKAAFNELTNVGAAASREAKWMSSSYRVRSFFLGKLWGVNEDIDE